jgi:rhomboid family GlyGly-CTERM serine protease
MGNPLTSPHPVRRPAWLLTGLLSAVMVALALAPGAAAWFQLDREAISAGEWWRVLTCHLVHWNDEHALWDVAVFAVLGGLCEARGRRTYAICLALSGAAIGLGVWFLLPDLDTYRGASGIDSALFGLLLVALLRESGPWPAWRGACLVGVVLGFAAKVAWEAAGGQTIFVDSIAAGMVPVPMVHALGGLIGAAVGIARTAPRPLVTLRRGATRGESLQAAGSAPFEGG